MSHMTLRKKLRIHWHELLSFVYITVVALLRLLALISSMTR